MFDASHSSPVRGGDGEEEPVYAFGDGPRAADDPNDDVAAEFYGNDDDDPSDWVEIVLQKWTDIAFKSDELDGELLSTAEKEWRKTFSDCNIEVGALGCDNISNDIRALLALYLTDFVKHVGRRINAVFNDENENTQNRRRSSGPPKQPVQNQEIAWFFHDELVCAWLNKSPTKLYASSKLRQHAKLSKKRYFEICQALSKIPDGEIGEVGSVPVVLRQLEKILQETCSRHFNVHAVYALDDDKAPVSSKKA